MKLFAIIGRKSAAFGLLACALCLASVPARACELAIIWRADLAGDPAGPTAQATGTAAIQFDFVHPGATVQVDTKNLQDVRSVELHVSRSYSDHAGPTVVTLYTANNGPFPATFNKHITDVDLQKQAEPRINTLADVVQAVLNGRAYVTVATKDHPQGELTGFIRMHKEAIYSDNPGDASHDPALHHAALSARKTE